MKALRLIILGLILLVVVVTGCGMQSLAWPVTPSTTVEQLDEKYHDQTATVDESYLCVFGDPLRLSYSPVSECERLQNQVWSDYWRARRDLADLKGWK